MRIRQVSVCMDEEDFTRAFIRVLSHETVVSKLSVIITKDLRAEITTLRCIIEKKDEKISMLEKRINHLENEQDALEEYTRRNSLRVSGLEELDNEDPAKVALCLFNSTMNMQSSDPVSINDIDRVHRVGKRSPGKARPLLVKFIYYYIALSVIWYTVRNYVFCSL